MLTKSDLLSFRQCRRKLWLEHHRPDLLPEPDSTSDRRAIDGLKVGEKARASLGAEFLWPPGHGDKAEAVERAREMLLDAPDRPAVEVPMLRDNLYARADVMVPGKDGYALRETKASTFPLKEDAVTPGAPRAHHLDDVAIQAWVMEGSGLDCAGVELTLLDNQWRYPGNNDYRGLFRQLDVTGLLSKRRAQVPIWLKAAQEVVAGPMPRALTGKQCWDPYDCPFFSFCKTQESPEPEHPIELLPDSAGKVLARTLREAKGYTSILEPAPAELIGKAAALYARMQSAHRDGRAPRKVTLNGHVGALLVTGDALFYSWRDKLIVLAARNSIPTMYYLRDFVTNGGLISYGASITDAYRQVGVYTGRVLFPEGVMKVLPIVFGSILLAVCEPSLADVRVETRSEVPLTPDAAQGSGLPIIHVDSDAGPGGDGSGRFPFDNIADALARAASLGGAVVVVEPGQYPVSSTLQIQSPIDLRGSNVMEVDAAGWPTGSIVPGTETRIVGTAALGAGALRRSQRQRRHSGSGDSELHLRFRSRTRRRHHFQPNPGLLPVRQRLQRAGS